MSVSFTARPVSIYKPFHESIEKGLTVYELETQDIDFLNKYRKSIKCDAYLKKEKAIYREIALTTLDSIIKSLKIKKNFLFSDKSVAYLAVCDKKVTSFIQGNLPKINLAENKIVYSTRSMPNETELDWLSSIPRNNEKTPKSAAPSVMAEFLNFCTNSKSKIKSIYCRSEIPDNCDKTVKFYEKLGFKAQGEKIKWESPNNPIDLNYFANLHNYKYSDDDILPMSITRAAAKKAVSDISKKFGREEIQNATSVDLNEIVV